jgi:hypothetical protein
MTPAADIRWQQRLSNVERALALLREAMVNGPAALNQLETEGVIQTRPPQSAVSHLQSSGV